MGTPFWIDPEGGTDLQPRVELRYILPPNLPLWLDGPANDVLSGLSVSRGQGTIFNITSAQWEQLVDAAGGWPGTTMRLPMPRTSSPNTPGARQLRRAFAFPRLCVEPSSFMPWRKQNNTSAPSGGQSRICLDHLRSHTSGSSCAVNPLPAFWCRRSRGSARRAPRSGTGFAQE